jgi:CheY-like chemotaxis protein
MLKINRVMLYVEDEEGDRLLMQMGFTNEGIQASLRLVNNGKLAVDYLTGAGEYGDRQAYPLPAVVLLDLNLPEIHGFDVLKWIRAHPLHSRMPVVVFTSSQRDDDRARAKLLGANDFLLKPNSANGFRQVARILNQRWLAAAPE